MTETATKKHTRACPHCGKECSVQGMNGHMRGVHKLSREEAGIECRRLFEVDRETIAERDEADAEHEQRHKRGANVEPKPDAEDDSLGAIVQRGLDWLFGE